MMKGKAKVNAKGKTEEKGKEGKGLVEGGGHVFVPLRSLVKRKQHRAKLSLGGNAFSLRDRVTWVYDQGNLGSCTSNAFATSFRLCRGDGFCPSRLFFYFFERLAEDPAHDGGDLTDSGADVVDGESFVKEKGICSEGLWPYDVSRYNEKPGDDCLAEAAGHKLRGYATIGADDVRGALKAFRPVLLAIAVYESFETAVGGVVPMPDKLSEKLLGGHELCIVGYDDDKRTYEVANSWGPGWGDNGFCHVPYDYVADPELCCELTVVDV